MGFLLQALNRLVPDPRPGLVFEIGDEVLVGVRRSGRVIDASAERPIPAPAAEGAGAKRDPDLLAAIDGILRELAPVPSSNTAVLLPDRDARLAVFDLERLPRRTQELRSAVEKRLSHSLPFRIRDARISYRIQGGDSSPSVLAAAASAASVRRYEAAFEAAGLIPGYVGVATAAGLNLIEDGPMTVLAKLGGDALTIVAIEDGTVRLVRRIALAVRSPADPEGAVNEILADLFPTVVYIEENLRTPVSRLLLCGFGDLLGPATRIMESDVQVPVETLPGDGGNGDSRGAGLMGYLHG